MFSEVYFDHNFFSQFYLNSLRANVAVQSDDGLSILRPVRGMIVLIPLQILNYPERKCTLYVIKGVLARSMSLPRCTARLIRLLVLPIHRRISAPSRDGKTETPL